MKQNKNRPDTTPAERAKAWRSFFQSRLELLMLAAKIIAAPAFFVWASRDLREVCQSAPPGAENILLVCSPPAWAYVFYCMFFVAVDSVVRQFATFHGILPDGARSGIIKRLRSHKTITLHSLYPQWLRFLHARVFNIWIVLGIGTVVIAAALQEIIALRPPQ